MVRSLHGKHPGYYEAILQLRMVSDDLRAYAERELQRERIPVTKIKKVTNGYDYYVADSRFTKALGKRLQQQFGGQQQVTASLITRKKDKEVYRVTVLLRGISFRKNDLVEYRGDSYRVKALGKDILLQDNDGRRAHVRWKDADALKNIKSV